MRVMPLPGQTSHPSQREVAGVAGGPSEEGVEAQAILGNVAVPHHTTDMSGGNQEHSSGSWGTPAWSGLVEREASLPPKGHQNLPPQLGHRAESSGKTVLQ